MNMVPMYLAHEAKTSAGMWFLKLVKKHKFADEFILSECLTRQPIEYS